MPGCCRATSLNPGSAGRARSRSSRAGSADGRLPLTHRGAGVHPKRGGVERGRPATATRHAKPAPSPDRLPRPVPAHRPSLANGTRVLGILDSNDNPSPESLFKTMEYLPTFPNGSGR